MTYKIGTNIQGVNATLKPNEPGEKFVLPRDESSALLGSQTKMLFFIWREVVKQVL